MDPLSIPAGVAGFVALGLTVSKGLIEYCQDFKSQDDDLWKLSQHAIMLEGFVNMARKRLDTKMPRSDIKEAIEECSLASGACLRGVNSFLDKNPIKDSSGTKDLLRRMSFPLKRSRLQNLQREMTEFNSALALTLQFLNM